MGSEHLYNAHFAQTLTTPAIISHHQMTPPPMDHHRSQTINMQDLSCMAGLPPTSHPSTPSQSQSPDGKTKKRKSWGQVLPEPKTNLPPRKRAKTEDEKEQRRIERVKRNRLAAHNSRERKRQEVEALQIEKDKVHDRLHAAERKLIQMAAELKAYRAKFPNQVPAQVDLDLTTSSSVDEYESTFGSDTINPRATSFPSPVSMEDYDSVRGDSCQPETPAYSESATTEFDQTQYPAAILCDLQCQSISVPPSRTSATSSPLASASTSTPPLPATLAYLTLFNLSLPMTTTSMSSLSSTLTSSLKTRRRHLVTRPTSSTLPSSMMPLLTLMAFLRRLAQDTSLCRLTLAQLLLLATSLSQRRSSSKQIARPTGMKGEIDQHVHIERRSRNHHRARRSSRTGVTGELRRIVRAFDWEKYQSGFGMEL